MKETSMCSLCKQSVQWDKMTVRQKLISVWFSLSFVVLGISGESLPFAILSLVNFVAAAYHVVKYVPMEDE
jgi:hypothetical protein